MSEITPQGDVKQDAKAAGARGFDIHTQQVAKVYAKAFIGAAQSSGQLTEVVSELDSLMDDVLLANPEFAKILGSNFISHEDKTGILDRVLGSQASKTMLAFLKVLSAHGRLGALSAVRQEVRRLYQVLQGEVEVLVQAAFPLDQTLSQSISDSLRKILGKEPKLKIETNPKLLGGLVVRVGDTVYDGSVANQLSQLKTRLIDRTVEEIETRRDRFLSESGSPNA